MKLLREFYGIASGSPRYRRMKALQLFATLRRQKAIQKPQQSSQSSLTSKNLEKRAILNPSSPSNKITAKKTQQQQLHQLQQEKKSKATTKPIETQSTLSPAEDSEIEMDEESDSQSESGESTPPTAVSLAADHSLRLSPTDHLIFISSGKRMTFKGEFQMTVLLGEVHVNGLRIAAKHVLSDQSKTQQLKVSSLPKNSLLSFETSAYDPETYLNRVTEANLLQVLNHNVISIALKADCDKVIDKICEKFDEISTRFKSDRNVNIVYVTSNTTHHTAAHSTQQPQKQSATAASNSSNATPFELIQITQIETAPSNSVIHWTNAQTKVLDRAVDRFLVPNSSTAHQQGSKCVLICGAKNSGKSMFSLYACNRLLNSFDRICILDTDLGQSLFHFPATVNLFSLSRKDIPLTNLTHISFVKPIVSVFVGEYSPQHFIQQYMQAIRKCMKFYAEFFANCPIVLNTHGYITNIGELLLYEIQDFVEPAIVAQLSKNENLHAHLKSANARQSRLSLTQKYKDTTSSTYCELFDAFSASFDSNQVKVNEAKRHRKDEMIFQYLTNQAKIDAHTYPFQQLFTSQYGQLCLQKPFEVPISAISFQLMDTRETVASNATEVAKHFNCAIVALFDASFNWNNPTANCIGFALIRDIDMKKGTVEIITSNSIINDLARVATFLKSSEVALSKHFYLHHQHVYQEIAELTYDIQANFTANRNLDVPHLLPKSCGLGNISFRSRVSSRK